VVICGTYLNPEAPAFSFFDSNIPLPNANENKNGRFT